MNKKYIFIGLHTLVWMLLAGQHHCRADALGNYMLPERANQVSKTWQQLKAGNDETVKAAAAAGDLEMLWALYLDAWGNKEIRTVIAAQLAAIPGHAQYAADMVESITNTTYDIYKPVQQYGGIMPRNYAFRILDSLGTLATPEAIQQIGRFLDDVRNPEMGGDLVTGRIRPLAANSSYALRALNNALGDQSPIAGKVNAVEMAEPGPYYAQVIREWWASDASLPFRQPLPGVALPEIVKNPPKLPHVNLDRYKPLPLGPPLVINMGPHKATPQAKAEAQRMLNRPPKKPHPFALPSRTYTPPAAVVPAPSSMLDSKWFYLLLAPILLLIPVWLATRRKKLQ
jgi:hypothetical protein